MSNTDTFLMYGELDAAELRGRAARFGFANVGSLEHLRWDYEFVAQLQALDTDFVLRGGAAAQLYLEPELQRGSVDVDFITSKQLGTIRKVVDSLVGAFNTIGVLIQEYTPRHPVPGLDQITYHVYFPKLEGRGGQRRIKLEIQRGPLGLPSNVVREKETLPLVVRNVRCLTRGALIGDKLTTLACNTIGVESEDLPKQLYDVANLTMGDKFSMKDVQDLLQGFRLVTQQQCGMRKTRYDPIATLDDISLSLTKFARKETGGGRLNQYSRQYIGTFASQYASRSGATDDSGWEAKSNLTEQLVEGVKERFKSKISDSQLRTLINALIPAR